MLFWQQNCFSQTDQTSASLRFTEAGALYKDGKYKEAIQIYEEILNNDLTSGALYYNLGNSYFKSGQLGKAILNYERAQQLMPRDNDLDANYNYAISLIKGSKIVPKQNIVAKFSRKYGNLMTINEITTIVYLLCVFIGIIYFVGIFMGWTPRTKILVLIVLGIAMVFHAFLFYEKVQGQKRLAVIITETESRFEPIDNTTVHFELPEGSRVKILNEEGDWFKVRRLDGKTGWSNREAIEKM